MNLLSWIDSCGRKGGPAVGTELGCTVCRLPVFVLGERLAVRALRAEGFRSWVQAPGASFLVMEGGTAVGTELGCTVCRLSSPLIEAISLDYSITSPHDGIPKLLPGVK